VGACLHVDLVIITPIRIRGVKYGILFTDDASYTCKVYLALNKNKALDTVKYITKFVKTQ